MSKKPGGKKKPQPRARSKASRKGKQNTVKGRIAEEVTARMYNAPLRNVERNAALPPVNRDSKLTRDIDVLLSSPIVSRRSERRAIECKNLNEKVDVEKIDAFVGKLQDVGIPYDHGIYVSTSGYTRDALDRARPAGIKLLKLTGLTEDRLKSLESPASQFSVFYLAQVTGFTVTNNVSVITKSEELMTFYDETDKSCSTVLDLIWNAWQEGELKSEAGEHKLSLKLPAGWHQIIDGKSVPVLGVTATVRVWALAMKFTGISTDHSLIDVADNEVEKRQINASFNIPRDEKTIYSLHTFKTEAELKTFIDEPQGAKLTIRTRLPRIQCMDAFFYPFSRRVAALLNEHMKEYKEGGTEELPALNISEVEGSDLRAMWEPLDEGYPGKIMPVIITDEKEDAAVDVTALLWAKEYKKVIALRERLERKPNLVLAEVIHNAYIGQGGLLLSEAEKRGGAEARRLLNRARAQVEEAIRIKPDSAGAFHNLGIVYKELCRYEEALSCFDRALAFDQDLFITWMNRAKVLTKLGRIKEAAASYDRALSLQPLDVEVIFYRSVLLSQLGRFDESVLGFDEVLKALPGHAQALHYRGLCMMKLSRFTEAVTSFEHVLSLDPANREAYVQKAWSLIQVKELDRAIEAINAAVSLAPTGAERYFPLKVRTIARHLKGMNGEAMSDLLAAWKLNPDELMHDQSAHSLIAAVYNSAPKTAETILMLAEMEWSAAALLASAGDETEAKRLAENATGFVESLVTDDGSGKLLSGGIMSGELVTGVMTRGARRLVDCRDTDLAREHIERMNMWISKIYGDTLTPLDDHLAQLKATPLGVGKKAEGVAR